VTVHLERDGALFVVTLDRPEARNAIDNATAAAVSAAMDTLDADDDLRVGVITGAGGTFCAGMDLKASLRGELPFTKERGFAGVTGTPPRKPLIAAIEGYALAGGTEIALHCDLVVAASDASFGLPEVKRSLVAAAGGLFLLGSTLPRQVAMELALLGEHVPAARMAALGLVNRVVEPGSALRVALELARAVAANAPLAVAATKEILVRAGDWTRAQSVQEQLAIYGPVFASADAVEGRRAFAEKRPAVWRNR